MAPTIFGGARNTAILTGQFAWPMENLTATATESFKAWPVRIAGTFSNFVGNYDANGTVRSTTLRKNSANSALSITPPDSTAGQFSDLTDKVHYTVGDTFDLTNVATGTAFILSGLSCMFTADTGTVGFYAAALVTSTSSVTGFSALGGLANSTDSAATRTVIRAPGTFSNMVVSAQANTSTAANPLTSRKNGANGNNTVTVASGTTGLFEDTTHSDSVVSGDTFGWQIASPAGGGGMTFQVGFTASFSTLASEITGACGNPSFSFSASNQFLSLLSSFIVFTAESGSSSGPALPLGCSGVLSNYRLNSQTNSMTGTLTFVVRKNGISGNQTIAIGAGVTGNFEDTTHSDSFRINSDQMNYMFSGGTSGTIVLGWSDITMTPIIPFGFQDWETGYYTQAKQVKVVGY